MKTMKSCLTKYCTISLLLLLSLTLLVGRAAAASVDNTCAKPLNGPGGPVLLWEKSFDPPLKNVSDRNGNGEFLAIQESEDGKPWKLLVLDGKGAIKREEILQGAEIKLSDSGDYYAVLTRGNEGWYKIVYKDKDGKTIQTIVPRDDYGFFHIQISYDGNTIVVVDMRSEEEDDKRKAPGQRVYFYNARGLVKDHDYGANPDAWLDAQKIAISKNGQYVAATRGSGNIKNSAIVLFDNSGRVLLEKRFFDRHYIHAVTNNGEILVSDYDLEKEALLVNREGKVVLTNNSPTRSDILLSDYGRFLLHGKNLIDAKSGKTIFRIDPAYHFGDIEVDATGYAGAPREDNPLVLVFGYSICCKKYYSTLVNFEEGRVLWRKENSICTFTNNGKLINCGNYQVYSFE